MPERDPTHDGEKIKMLTKPCAVRSITRSPDKRKHERILEMDGPVTRRELKFYEKNPVARKTMLQFQNFPFDKFDALDAVHDMWVGTMKPPPVIEDTPPMIPRELQKILQAQMYGKRKGQIVGTIAPSRLSAWS